MNRAESFRLALITGGAASGKSRFAEALVTGTGRPRCYIATARAWDDEMRAKIARHRDQRGSGWRLVEAPEALADALRAVGAEETVLVDCLTMWLSNLLLAEADLDRAAADLCGALRDCPAQVVCVTNEVGLGIVPDNALARRFRDAQGRLNQTVAGQADLAVAVMAGLPLVLKGHLPDG
ncbi:MAG: bifunctional adenosylcobinamide kinase/adenosylcobinamide-phosphate guanylyltransferase [Rhodobacteraceae bacterium]|nr:bifunctional adenosylcobinamide kinase/adenosylcobinamide-phosphate guanylyltransferase [Paracoccaceae bacterium]